jgi:hypothetical protein
MKGKEAAIFLTLILSHAFGVRKSGPFEPVA